MSILNANPLTFATRTLLGPHLGSSKRSYHERLEDGADLVEGKAVRRSPTVRQAAADVNVDPTTLWQVLHERGWRAYQRRGQHPTKKRGSDDQQLDLIALRRMAFALGTDALLEELAAMGAPAVPVNGNGTADAPTNGAGQHIDI